MKYRKEILVSFVTPYASNICDELILIHDNVRSHSGKFADLDDQGLERMGW